MQYDASGNMIYQHDAQKGLAKQIAYDSKNRIQNVTNPQNGEKVGEYWYDDQGFRVRKISRREENEEQKDIEILYPCMYMGMELHGTSYGVVNNVYMNGLRVAAMIPDGGAVYFLTDQVDSVKVVVNDQGKALTRYEYKPYGESWFTEGEEGFAPKFNSQELDKETNYYFFNARYYDPEICRFLTADNRIDNQYDTQSWNRFSYVKGNPIIYKDPTGHVPWVAIIKAVAKVVLNEAKKAIINQARQAIIKAIAGSNPIANLFLNKLSAKQLVTVSQALKKPNDSAIKRIATKDKMPDFGSPLVTVTNEDQLKNLRSGGLISSPYGRRSLGGSREFHPGIDFLASEGTEIKAAAKGKISFHVEYLKDEKKKLVLDGKGNPIIAGYGHYAIIEHEGNYKTYYAHMNESDWSKYKETFSKNLMVEKGATIGGVGNSGRSAGSPGDHLHFEIREGWKKPINPTEILQESLSKR